MQPKLILTDMPPQPITPEEIMRAVMNLQMQVAKALDILVQEIYMIDAPEDFQSRFDADFKAITAALKENPRALTDPAALTTTPESIKRLYKLIQIIQPLIPSNNDIQIVRPA